MGQAIGLFVVGIRYREADEADGAVGILHLGEQALGKGEDDLHGEQLLLLGDAAGNLGEVVKLDLQRQCVAVEVFGGEAAQQLLGGVV